jgi:iron complex transport system ATP-binding protein
LRRLARETGVAILLSTHDLDLALRLADRLWLLSSAGGMEIGLPEELALSGAVARVFQSEGAQFDHAIGAFRVHQAVHGSISLDGRGYGVTAAWTWRALERLGYEVHNGSNRHPLHVEILSESCWRLITPAGESEHPSLESLLRTITKHE